MRGPSGPGGGIAVGVARWIGAAGMLAAGIAGLTNSGLLLMMVLGASAGDSFQPLFFGWIGLSASAALAGGWVGHRWWQRRGDTAAAPLRSDRISAPLGAGARLAITTMAMWVACEFVIRLWGSDTASGVVQSRRLIMQ